MPKEAKRQRNGATKKIAAAPTTPVGALKLKEARQYLGGLAIPTIHRLIKRGLMRPNRSTSHLLFPVTELDRFLREGMSE